MTVSLCIWQESKRNDDSVSVEELDWSAESSWTPLCDFKWATNSSPNTNDLFIWDTVIFHTLQNRCNRSGNTMFKYMNYVSIFVGTVCKCFFTSKEGGVSTFVHIMNVKSLVFGDEFVAHLKSHQRCSAGIRPVKFFHTDWIIISLWFLSYTQRHCHAIIEKSAVQTVAIQLDSLQYHYILKH